MNKRTKELAEEAGFMLWADEHWNPGDVIDWSARYDDELEKLVELVRDDCHKKYRELAYELMGVIADVEQGDGFDQVCLHTINRVCEALSKR